MANVWKAANTVCKINTASNVTITSAAVLDSFFSAATSIEASMKDVTITEPMGKAEKIDLQGTDSSGYQNAEMEEKPANVAEISGTLILKGDEVIEGFIYGGGTAIAGTHTRYSPGLASVPKLAILVNLDDGTDEVSIAMDNVYFTEKDTKISGADSHFEISFTAVCLPRDFYGPEFKD